MPTRHVATALLVIAWALLVPAAMAAHVLFVWHPPVTPGDATSIDGHLRDELQRALDDGRLASGALVLLRRGRIAVEQAVGVADQRTGTPATTDRTLYVVASVSKAVTAWGVMSLVQAARLTLDEPVLSHLTRWRFPSSAAYRDHVTVRHLLSHTAGLDDGLGYGGFAAGEPVQRIEESLSGPRDSTVGPLGEVTIVREPGTAMAYSGGGYAVLQLLVEEVTGQTAHDVARFAQAFIHPNPVLKPETVQQLLTAQPSTGGSWGLGHALFADAGPAARVVGHDGGTPPSWGASVRVNPVAPRA